MRLTFVLLLRLFHAAYAYIETDRENVRERRARVTTSGAGLDLTGSKKRRPRLARYNKSRSTAIIYVLRIEIKFIFLTAKMYDRNHRKVVQRDASSSTLAYKKLMSTETIHLKRYNHYTFLCKNMYFSV